MKVKAGSGRPIDTNRLQSLQSGLFSPIKVNIYFISDLRYKNSSDWRDWSPLENIGEPLVTSNRNLGQLAEPWRVSRQCLRKWSKITEQDVKSGTVCICGHPTASHEGGGLCDMGYLVCVCRRPRPVIWVDDIRYFYRATKGPHEAHALVLGLAELVRGGGTAQYQVAWRCEYRGCTGRISVNPARFRNASDLALGMPVNDLNKLICEPCLFRELNGGYTNE